MRGQNNQKDQTMKGYVVVLCLVAATSTTSHADTAWSRASHYYDRDGGDCTDLDADGRQFYGYVEEGTVDFSEERRAYIGGSIQNMNETKSGLIQMLLSDDASGGFEDWYTFDPEHGYIADGRLTDPKAVKDGHLMSYPLVPCN